MKKIFFISLILTALISCNKKEDFNIYAEKESTMIVYGLINPELDTNYLKITKSFTGDAVVGAQDYEMSNYDHKLYVALIPLSNTRDSILFDTTSVFKPYVKPMDSFAAHFYSGRNQLLYYAPKSSKLIAGHKYRLYIRDKVNDTVRNVVTSEITMTSGYYISWPMSPSISFEGYSDKTEIKWRLNNPSDAWAPYYEVTGYFYYTQQLPGEEEITNEVLKWVIKKGKEDDFVSTYGEHHCFYRPNMFYDVMAADENIKNNSPEGVKRWFGHFDLVISSVGQELYNYTLSNASTGAIQDAPEYSNVEGGLGLVSSRFMVTKHYDIATVTINNLRRDHPEWGFQMPTIK